MLADDDLDDALRWADVVVSSADGDPDAARALHARVAAADPSTVHVVLSGFGLSGPYAGWRSTPLIDWASGGYLYLTGEPDREPLQGGGPWAAYVHGATAAIGAQAAVFHAARTGEGQLVDVGAMESVAAAHQWSLTMYTHTGAVKRRWGRRFGESFHPMGPYQTGDGGWIAVGAASRDQWDNFCITTDTVELMADETLYSAAERFERCEEIDALVAPWLAARTADEAVAAFQEHRVPASKLLDFVGVLGSEQLAARDYFQPRPDVGAGAVVPSRPFGLGAAPLLGPPPERGADTDAFRRELATPPPRDPLPTVDLGATRLVEFGIAWAGPLAARTLGDLGVDVVKVEHPMSRGFGTGGNMTTDLPWRWGRARAAGDPGRDLPAGRSRRAAVEPDGHVEQDEPQQAEPVPRRQAGGGRGRAAGAHRLGRPRRAQLHAAWRPVARHRPRAPRRWATRGVASVAMTGYGETGPLASHSSYGPMLEAHAGFAAATGYIGEEPLRIGLAFPDAVGGLHGAFALLSALWERELTGAAVHVDLSQLETLLAIAGESVLAASATGTAPPRHGNRSADHAPQGVYRCDGADAWVAVTVQGDAEWARLVALVGDEALQPLRRRRPRGARSGARRDRRRDRRAGPPRARRSSPPRSCSRSASPRVPRSPTATSCSTSTSPLVASSSRGTTPTSVASATRARRSTSSGHPCGSGRRRCSVSTTASILGELGYDDAAIDALMASGIVADAPTA